MFCRITRQVTNSLLFRSHETKNSTILRVCSRLPLWRGIINITWFRLYWWCVVFFSIKKHFSSISIASEVLHHFSLIVGSNIAANKKLSSDMEIPRRLSNDNFKVLTILLLYVITDNSFNWCFKHINIGITKLADTDLYFWTISVASSNGFSI